MPAAVVLANVDVRTLIRAGPLSTIPRPVVFVNLTLVMLIAELLPDKSEVFPEKYSPPPAPADSALSGVAGLEQAVLIRTFGSRIAKVVVASGVVAHVLTIVITVAVLLAIGNVWPLPVPPVVTRYFPRKSLTVHVP